jgi:hypothetical protein
MRSSWINLLAAASLLAAPMAASADDAAVQAQLEQMQQRLLLLEDKLSSTSEQLDAATAQVNEQKQVMSNAGMAVDDAGASGTSSFLQSLEIGGWVNVSYWHNFNDPTNGEFNDPIAGPGGTGLPASFNANTGNAATALGLTTGSPFPGFFNPTNPDSQGFSFDQLWFELERPVSPEQRSGFRADVTFGKVADILSGRNNARSDDDIYIHQANIQYLWDAPWLGDTKLTLGKFSTLIGYEVAQAAYNHNISRSVLWGLLQPVDHLGFLMSGTIDQQYHLFGVEGALDWDLGVVNGFSTDDPDVNHSKTWTGRIRMTGENWSIAVAGITGPEDGAAVDCTDEEFDCDGFASLIGGRTLVDLDNIVATNVGVGGSESEHVTLIDVIFTWDPFTDLNLWMNFDRMWVNPDGYDPDAWGISVGGHYTINERTAFTLRTEFMQWEDAGGSLLGFTNLALPFAANPDTPVFGDSCYDGFPDDENTRCTWGTEADVISITATLHYQLTDQIKVRGELRWDDIEVFGRRGNQGLLATDQIFNEGTANPFPSNKPNANVAGGDSDQLMGGIDVIYEF